MGRERSALDALRAVSRRRHRTTMIWHNISLYPSLYPFLSCSSRWIAWSSLVSLPFHPELRTPSSPDRLCLPPASLPFPSVAPNLVLFRPVGARFTIFALTLSTVIRLIERRTRERNKQTGKHAQTGVSYRKLFFHRFRMLGAFDRLLTDI